MKLYRLTSFPVLPEVKDSVVALGNFDGMHLGHRHVIQTAQMIAAQSGAKTAIFTFKPHPRAVFQPDEAPFRLTPFRSKVRLIAQAGIDHFLLQRFNEVFAGLSAEDFVTQILCEKLAVRHLVVGEGFRFGRKREGTPELLVELGQRHGFGVTQVPPVIDDAGEVCSSTRIRDLLKSGDLVKAEALLGRMWEIEGRIALGEGRGRKLGFPTANVPLAGYLRPRYGVYAVKVMIDGEAQWRDGVANIGLRPTFGEKEDLLEVHVFDYQGNLYSKRMRVALAAFLRPEQKFETRDALKAYIERDCQLARVVLQNVSLPLAS